MAGSLEQFPFLFREMERIRRGLIGRGNSRRAVGSRKAMAEIARRLVREQQNRIRNQEFEG